MKNFLLAGSIVMAFGACSVVETGDEVWFKEGATAREREVALAAAHSQATQATSGKPDPADQTKKQIVVTSMTAQGWRLVHKNAAPAPEPETARKLPPPRTY